MTERIVPDYPDDGVPISRLDEFYAHLQQLESDASIPFDIKLLDDIELQLSETNIPPLLPSVLPPLTQILKTTNQEPSPLLSLAIKFLSPLSFTQALTIADSNALLAAFESSHPGANLLALAILHKAAKTPSDAAILSTMPQVVEEMVRCWLDSHDVGVGERAAKVLGDLLETDCPIVSLGEVNGLTSPSFMNGTESLAPRVPGHARLWRLLLSEDPMLSLITTLCTFDQTSLDSDFNPRPPRQTSLSQGRLLRLLPRLATLDIRAINRTELPHLFPLPSHVVQVAGQGLLQWAALAMVDKSGDMLMHLTLVDFFERFVSIMAVTGSVAEEKTTVGNLVRAAVQDDEVLMEALTTLPDRTVEAEAERLRNYITEILGFDVQG